ncbi:MAG: hypothetical protein R2755_01905 [Acidimicrobiales bacterium]
MGSPGATPGRAPARRPVPSHRRRPLLARRARLSLLAAVGTWEALITAMWWWWLTAAEHGDPVGFVAVTAALVPLTVLGPASYLIGAARLHRVEPSRHAGSGTPQVLVAVVRLAGVADVAVRHTVQVLQQQLDRDGQDGRRGPGTPRAGPCTSPSATTRPIPACSPGATSGVCTSPPARGRRLPAAALARPGR